MIAFRPAHSNVLVKPLNSKTSGGLELPPGATEGGYMRGLVVAVGPGRLCSHPANARHASQFAVGDVVAFLERDPSAPWPRLMLNGEQHVLLPDDAVLGAEVGDE